MARVENHLEPTNETGATSESRESTAEGRALLGALDAVAPTAATACPDWTAHELLAHLAAGAKERADLVEEKLAGLPPRATRPFDEREAVFRELPDVELRRALVAERSRAEAAVAALERRRETIRFTGREFSAGELTTHMRSEAILHRWDLVGSDRTGIELMAQPDLTRHAVTILNELPLAESPRARARTAQVSGLCIVLRVPGEPDVVFLADPDDGRFEISASPPAPDVVMTMDAAARLLTIWGRWPGRPVTVTATHGGELVVAASALWPAAVAPRTR
jgi:uncharacterized protein (TIGR03083 family)